MPDAKITALTSIGTSTDPANDPLVLVDVSDTSMAASGTTKKVTLNQLLATSPTATLASATITGDLTAARLTVTGSTIPANGVYLPSANTVGVSSNSILQHIIAPLGVFQWFDGAGGTRMALNSNGLIRGGTVADIVGVESTTLTNIGNIGAAYASTTGTYFVAKVGAANGIVELKADARTGAYPPMAFTVGGSERMRIDSSGNVGVGVTPSAWNSNYKAIESGASGGAVSTTSNLIDLSQNAYFSASSAWTYKNTAAATLLRQTAGSYQFLQAGSGTAGNTITWTQAMTLTASGDLLVGKTAASATTVGFQAESSGGAVSVRSGSTNSELTWYTYSTGAAAARFYVGMAGTVFATNTTISAISDARFKENVQDIDVGLGAILALKPRKFDWKAGKGKDIKGDRGFIAQEFEQVFPQLVDKWADPSPEGEAPYKSVRQDLIPVLVKAIQELAAEVNALKNA